MGTTGNEMEVKEMGAEDTQGNQKKKERMRREELRPGIKREFVSI